MSEEKRYDRHPLGVQPEHLWKEGRIEDLRQAIDRHLDAGHWPRVEWIREMADLVEERIQYGRPADLELTEVVADALREMQRSPLRPAPCPDAEIDGLPSTAQPRPSPSTPVLQTPTAETLDPLDAAVEVLSRIVLDRELPGGEPVQSALWLHRTLGCSRITFQWNGRTYTAETYRRGDSADAGPEFQVEDVTDGARVRDTVTMGLARDLRNAAIDRLQASRHKEGLQEPQTPRSPMDAGWDDWVDLKTRVDNSDFRPWWDERAGWCAISPATGKVQFFGRLDSDRDVAYRWIDHLLSLRPMVENHPPSVSEPVS